MLICVIIEYIFVLWIRYTTVQKFSLSKIIFLDKWILLFSKDAVNW